MTKWKRTVVGSVLKSKEANEPDYVKISGDITLKKGQTLKLESKKARLATLSELVQAGKISQDMYDDMRVKTEARPDFVRFDIVLVEKQG